VPARRSDRQNPYLRTPAAVGEDLAAVLTALPRLEICSSACPGSDRAWLAEEVMNRSKGAQPMRPHPALSAPSPSQAAKCRGYNLTVTDRPVR
jgi:hypothetical protein